MTGKLQTSLAAAAFAAVLVGVSVPAVAGDAKPDPMQVARGAKEWANNCGRCHNFRDPKEKTDAAWDVVVNHMRIIAPLPGAVARDIKAFLQASN
jgi:hypothetical protein